MIPTLNEVANIALVLERTQRALDSILRDYEIIVVDDSSDDGTVAAARTIAAGDHRVRVCVRCGERGLAGAIQHGWRQTDAEYLGVMDADLQHPPEILPVMLRSALRGCDVVVASRYAPGGSCERWTLARRATSLLAVLAALPLQKRELRVRDPMSGFFLVRRNCVKGCKLGTQGFKLLLEMLVRADLRSSSEVPYAFELRAGGRSKLTTTVALSYFSLLAKLYRFRFLDGRADLARANALQSTRRRTELAPIPHPEMTGESPLV